MERLLSSPLTMVVAGQSRPGGFLLPSMSACAGGWGSPSSARRMARKVACKMFSVSISSTEASAMLASQSSISGWKRASRCLGESFLLSRMWLAISSGNPCAGIITAAATTGPAKGPRPTSSMPHTSKPSARPVEFSNDKSVMRLILHKNRGLTQVKKSLSQSVNEVNNTPTVATRVLINNEETEAVLRQIFSKSGLVSEAKSPKRANDVIKNSSNDRKKS